LRVRRLYAVFGGMPALVVGAIINRPRLHVRSQNEHTLIVAAHSVHLGSYQT